MAAKHFLFTIIGVCIVTQSLAQSSGDFQLQPINRSNTTFILSPYFSITGRTRTVIPIELPPNSVGFYYQVETTVEKKDKSVDKRNGENDNSIFQNCIDGIQKGLNAKQELTKAVIQYITEPKGDGQCDIYLLDQYNSQLFENKTDRLGGEKFQAHNGEQMLSVAQTNSVVSMGPEKLYLGIRNPSSEVIQVKVILIAVIKKRTSTKVASASAKQNGWDGISDLLTTSNIKTWCNELFSKNISRFWNNSIETKDAVNSCVLTSIQSKHKHSNFGFFESQKQKEIVFTVFKECASSFVFQFSEKEQKANKLGNLAWEFYKKGDYANCISFSKKAMEVDSLPFVQLNISLSHLAQGNETDALLGYVEAIELLKRKQYPIPIKIKYLEGAIQDLNELKAKKGSNSIIDQTIKLLTDEKRQYH